MLNGLFNIGQSALNASQAWISVTGNNLANVDTEGYSRQYVDQKDAGGLTYKPGAQPLGVNAQQIMRFFDQFLERSYVKQSTNSSRWDQQDTILAEQLFQRLAGSGPAPRFPGQPRKPDFLFGQPCRHVFHQHGRHQVHPDGHERLHRP